MPVPVGEIVWDSLTYSLTAPSENNVVLPDEFNHFSLVYFPSSATITGIVRSDRGRPIWVTSTRDSFTLTHDDSGSDAENRFYLPGGADLVLGQYDTVCLVYDHAYSRWVVSQGGFADVAYSGSYDDLTGTPPVPTLYKVLDAAAGANNGTSAQPWFPSAGAVSVEANTLYRFDGELRLLHGTTSCAVRVGFGGTATLNFIAYQGVGTKRTMNANGNNSQQTMSNNTSLVNITTANTVGGAIIRASGIVSVDAAGTLIPQFGFTAAPGFPAVQVGTFFGLTKLGADTDLTRGTWS